MMRMRLKQIRSTTLRYMYFGACFFGDVAEEMIRIRVYRKFDAACDEKSLFSGNYGYLEVHASVTPTGATVEMALQNVANLIRKAFRQCLKCTFLA
ncbi:unnamed protein product [Peronospora belbahrii]|uniref:DNA-directed RNA polymerase RBP11-like dimerisation domain-containing protein n=1 Tax=Peronospora belbahrii TaxID=622444 RepID=A0ABN8D4C7_9STRA|nr:unnamed protein product [Peronospora belbahrii]